MMEFFGMAITVLAAILTYQAWKNGRWMKQSHQNTQDLIKEMHRDMAEVFLRMDETLRRMDGTLGKMDETSKEMQKRTDETSKEMQKRTDETLKEMQKGTDETLKEIARLIVAEGEKTRQAVLQKS